MSIFKRIIPFLMVLMITANCGGGLSKVDARKGPVKGIDRAKKNIEEGKGLSMGNILKRRGGEFAFSSSNPMWRASLEILDFMPMTTVDYSGGMIISDWYTDNNKTDESIKITVRFLSNEIRSDSLKIIVHKKNCDQNQNCRITLLNGSQISDKLRGSILRKAALLEKESKSKKKNKSQWKE